MRSVVFICTVLPMTLAVTAAPAFASPVSGQVGGAHAVIVVSPDPPRVGTDRVFVTLSGVSPNALARTTVQYSTVMPSMQMAGPSGTAARVAGRTGEWRFDVAFGMAAPWTLHLKFAGGVSGALDVRFDVAAAARAVSHATSSESMAAAAPASSMAGMNVSANGATTWRNAALALLVVLVIAAIVFQRNSNRNRSAIAMLIMAGVVVVGVAFAQSYGDSSANMSSMQSAQGSAPVPVTLAVIRGARFGTTIAAPASVQPYFVQNIVARAPGVLTGFSAYTGDRLSAGEIVAHLSEPELKSTAQAAQSAARAAQSQRVTAQYDASAIQAGIAAKQQQLAYWKEEIVREKSLLDQGAVSLQEYQSERAQASAAQSSYNAARAKLAGAQANIEAARAQAAQAASNAQAQSVTAGYTNVIVPDDAIVMKRLVDPGVYVEAGTAILQVAVIHRLRVQAQISQQDLAGVQIGTPIDVTFADGNVVHSRISSISPVVDANTHTAIAEAVVANPGNRYQPGAFVHTVLHVRGTASRRSFSVPSGAIVGGASAAVWIDLNGTAHRVPVTVVSDDGMTAQVTGDLRAGTRVIATGATNVEEGEPIVERRS